MPLVGVRQAEDLVAAVPVNAHQPATAGQGAVDGNRRAAHAPGSPGVRGAQLAGRASLIECGPLPARLGNKQPFTDTITDLENALGLHHHLPGTLSRHATYLHQRTAGRIGSHTRLIRQAAITAIHDATERITTTTLGAIRLDRPAETTHPPKTRRSNR